MVCLRPTRARRLPEIAEGAVPDRDPPVATVVDPGDLRQLVGKVEEVRDAASGHRVILTARADTPGRETDGATRA